MDIDVGIGLGLYVAGLVLFVQTIAESAPVKNRMVAKIAIIITLMLFGAILMVNYG